MRITSAAAIAQGFKVWTNGRNEWRYYFNGAKEFAPAVVALFPDMDKSRVVGALEGAQIWLAKNGELHINIYRDFAPVVEKMIASRVQAVRRESAKFSSDLMKAAWHIRRQAARRMGCKVSEVLWSECLKIARTML